MASISPTNVSCPPEPHTGQGAYLKFTVTSITDSDAATNERYISWKITFQGTPWVQLYGAYAKLGNVTIVPYENPGTTNWYVGQIYKSGTTTFTNDNNGNLSLNLYMKQLFFYGSWAWNSNGYYQDVSSTLVCSQLLRYANFTNHSATSEINKIVVNYSADANYKAQQYSLNGRAWTNCTAGSYTLTGLTPNTNYTIKTKIQRTDSDLWTESDTITIKTKALPTSIAPPNINFNGSAGNTITPSVSFMDYLSSWYIIVYDGATQVRSFSNNVSTTTSKNYTLTASDFTNMLPRHTNTDNWNLTIKYKCISNNITYDLTDRTCKVTIPTGQYSPIYNTNNLSYAVTDNTTLNLNNNATNKVIKGISNVTVTSTAASPQGSATIVSYNAISGTKANSTTNTTAPININLTGVDGNSISVQVIDSRGRNTTAIKNYDAFIDYFVPIIDTSSATRIDGIGTNIAVSITGRYCNWSGLATSNTVDQVSIKYKLKSSSTWTTKTGITLTKTVGSGNFSFTGNITGNNFVATEEYDLLITLQDKITTFEYQASIPVGKALLWRDMTNYRIGINKKPNHALDVDGNINASSYLYGNNATISNTTTTKDLVASGTANITGALTAGIVNGYQWDTATNNTTDTWVPVFNGSKIQHRVLSTDLNSRGVKALSSKSHTNFSSDSTKLPDISMISYWNGAYNSSNASNLTYCNDGEIQAKPIVGTSGMWRYRKWSDGTAELWGVTSKLTFNIATAWGNIYESPELSSNISDFPFAFVEPPHAEISITEGNYNYLSIERGSTNTTKILQVYLTRPTIQNGFTCKLNIYVTGRWK